MAGKMNIFRNFSRFNSLALRLTGKLYGVFLLILAAAA
jgi:hypothetical protein